MRQATDDELRAMKPEPPEDLTHKLREFMVKSIADQITDLWLNSTTTSTSSSAQLLALTVDSIREMEKTLEQPKLTKREQIMQAAGVGSPFGVKIIVSPYCYETRVEVRGLADVRKPNRKKMLYRRVRVTIPRAYLTSNGVICHPSLEAGIRQKLAAAMELE